MPQEHGAHVDTSWLALTDGRGSGIRLGGIAPLTMTARAHDDMALAAARTLAELGTADRTEVHLDLAVRGLGTGACGPRTGDRYLVRGGELSWTWWLEAIGQVGAQRPER